MIERERESVCVSLSVLRERKCVMHECVGVWLFVQGERTRERKRERASVSICGTSLSLNLLHKWQQSSFQL